MGRAGSLCSPQGERAPLPLLEALPEAPAKVLGPGTFSYLQSQQTATPVPSGYPAPSQDPCDDPGPSRRIQGPPHPKSLNPTTPAKSLCHEGNIQSSFQALEYGLLGGLILSTTGSFPLGLSKSLGPLQGWLMVMEACLPQVSAAPHLLYQHPHQ